jgi:hypothetical protein
MRYAWRRFVVRDPDLSDATRRVLLELESYADPDGTNARPGIKRISEALATPNEKHVSERTVRRALENGVERGFIFLDEPAPRGRGNRRADVYRLTFPPTALAPEIPDTQMSTIATEKVDTQMSTNAGGNSGHESVISGHPDPYYWTPGCPPTSSLTPDHPPERVGYVSNAGARATRADETPTPSLGGVESNGADVVRLPLRAAADDIPTQTPMDQLRARFGRLTDDELAIAESLFAEGQTFYAVAPVIEQGRKRTSGRRRATPPPRHTGDTTKGPQIDTPSAETRHA